MELTNVETMTAVARDTLGMPKGRKVSSEREDADFRGCFGVPISTIVEVWNMIAPSVDEPGACLKHLLWSLVFIKVYSTEIVHCRMVGWPDPKTFRKWSWYFLEKMTTLMARVVDFDRRFDDFDGKAACLISVDCFDCMIMEPWPFDEKWFSQKFNGPGLKYELGVCIKTGRIVWLNGPFKAGKGDATICKEKLLTLLADDEGVEVDGGYKGSDRFKNPVTASSRNARKQKSVVRGRHENVNGRIKIFNVLNVPFRHMNPRNEMMEKHRLCTEACVVLTQLKFDSGESLYDVPYDVHYT